jgi:hypothetical protein
MCMSGETVILRKLLKEMEGIRRELSAIRESLDGLSK